MKRLRKISFVFVKIFSVLFLAVSFSTVAYAALEEYTVLTPLPGTTVQGCTTGGCKSNLSTYLPGAFNLTIGLAAALAFVMITYGGIQYMTSDAISTKSKGRETITNAISGLILIIAAYAILYTINPKILNFKLDPVYPFGDNSLQVINYNAAADAAAIEAASKSTTPVSGSDLLSGQSYEADLAKRILLAQKTIGVNNQPCTSTRTTSCTNVNNLTPEMIASLGTVQSGVCASNKTLSCSTQCIPDNAGSSRCAVTITGGDENHLHNPGTAHGNGTTVDLAPTAYLNAYLSKTNPAAATPQNNTQVKVNGMTFTYEVLKANAANNGAHWHVTKP